MIKAILFDLDGTLINTNRLIINSFKHTFLAELDIRIMEEEIVKLFGEPLWKSMEKYGRENVDKLVKSFHEYNEANHDKLTEGFEGVEQALKSLKEKGIKLAVVTSKRKVMVDRGLKLFDFESYFDVIITPEDTLKHKPEADPAIKACEILGFNPGDTLMVGDSHNDILCGKNAGCKTCLVTYTMLPLEELLSLEPDYVIDDIEELIEIVTGVDKLKKSSV